MPLNIIIIFTVSYASFTDSTDTVYLVLWYRELAGKPLYSFDIRSPAVPSSNISQIALNLLKGQRESRCTFRGDTIYAMRFK
jgi:hypothetical protein